MGLVQNVKDDGFAGLEHNFLTGQLEDLVRWARRRSSWPATFGLACCAIEMMAAGGPHYDLARFGIQEHRLGAAFLSLLGVGVVGFMVLFTAKRAELLERNERVREMLASWDG